MYSVAINSAYSECFNAKYYVCSIIITFKGKFLNTDTKDPGSMMMWDMKQLRLKCKPVSLSTQGSLGTQGACLRGLA